MQWRPDSTPRTSLQRCLLTQPLPTTIPRFWLTQVCDFNLSKIMVEEGSMAASSTAVTNPRWVQHRSVPSRPTALHPTTPHSTSTLVAHPAMHCLPACSFCAQAPWPRELAFFCSVLLANSLTARLLPCCRWLAPEVLAGGTHTRASDVYAYGVVLWGKVLLEPHQRGPG